MTTHDVGEVLRAFRVPRTTNWYALGVGQSRVTVYTQQVRALNLAWALRECKAVDNGPVVVIGGGVAGLSVAAGLAQHKIESVVLERERHLVPLQRNCRKRHLHPHIFDWPEETAENTHADLPLLDWRAGMARDVALSIEASFIEAEQTAGGVLHQVCAVEQLNLDTPRVGQVSWVDPQSGKRFCSDYGALVFAVGFGVEENFLFGSRGAYWADDSLEQHGVVPNGRYLVSGAGDGGLIDTFRLLLPELKQAELARIVGSCTDLRALRDKLNQIDSDVAARGAPLRARGELSLAREVEGAALHDFYASLNGLERLDARLSEKLTKRITVSLLCSGASPFLLETRPLHRLILSRLFFRAGTWLDVRTGVRLTETMLKREGQKMILAGDVGEPFTHVIMRHGPKALAAYEGLPKVQGLLATLDAGKVPREACFPTDFFGRAPTGYRGAGGPDQDDYLDELRGSGFLVLTAAGIKVPLSRFSEVAVELLAEPSAHEDLTPVDDGEAVRKTEAEESETRYRARVWDRRTGISVLPSATLTQLAGYAFVRGEAGTGKTTLLKHAIHAAVEAFDLAEPEDHKADGDHGKRRARRFPIVVSGPPHMEAWGDDIEGALVEAALRSAEISNFSMAARELRKHLRDGACIVFLDAAESWSANTFREVTRWLSARGIHFLAAARRFPFPPERLGIGSAARFELVGLAPTSARRFVELHLATLPNVKERAAHVLSQLAKVPNATIWRRTPFLLAEFSRAFQDTTAGDKFSALQLYEERINAILLQLNEDAVRVAKSIAKVTLCRTPSRFAFSQNEIALSVRADLRRSGLFTGSDRLEFVHLTFGEYLASLGASAQEMREARKELRDADSTWHHQLEVLAMAHAASLELLDEAYEELEHFDDPEHRQLSLVLRAVGYGGAAVEAFCLRRAHSLVETLLSRAATPNGTFGERERELFRHAARALPYVRTLQAPPVPPGDLVGEPAAEAWVVQSKLGLPVPTRPADSIWWATVYHQADALLLSGQPVAEVVATTLGGEDAWEQGSAARVLDAGAQLRALLLDPDERTRMEGFQPEKSIVEELGLLADPSPRLRSWAVGSMLELIGLRESRPILRDILRRDPSAEVRAAALAPFSGAEQFEPDELDLLLTTLRDLLRPRNVISGDMSDLLGALANALRNSDEAESIFADGLDAGMSWYFHRKDLTLLCQAPRLWDLIEARVIDGRSTNTEEMATVASSSAVQARARSMLADFLSDPKGKHSRIPAAIAALPTNDLASRADRIRCLDLDNDPRRWIVSEAIRSLGQDADAVALLRRFLRHDAEPSLADAALAAIGRLHEVRDLVRALAGGDNYKMNQARLAAIKLLGEDPSEWPELRRLFEVITSSPHEKTQFSRNYIRAELLRAFASAEQSDWLLQYLEDKDDVVRDVVIETLLQRDPVPAALYQRAYKETSMVGRRKLWEHYARDAALRAELEKRAREDASPLRRAYFEAVSGEEHRAEELRQFFLAQINEQGRGRIVADLVPSMARDPAARPLLHDLVKGTARGITGAVLFTLRDDAELRKNCHALLGDSNWFRQFIWGSGLVEYFRDDREGQRIIYEKVFQGGQPQLILSDLIPALRGFEPAKKQLILLATDDTVELNIRNNARHAVIDEPSVRDAVMADLGKDKDAITRAAQLLEDEPSAWASLAGLTGHREKRVRSIAYRAAARLGIMPMASEQFPGGEEEPELKRQLIQNVDAYKWPSAAEREAALLRAMNDHDWEIRQLATDRLDALGDREVDRRPQANLLRSWLRDRGATGAPLEGDVAQFVTSDSVLREADQPQLFASVVSWLAAKLVSTLPADSQSASTHTDRPEAIFGEILAFDSPADALVIRLAKDSFELPRDRNIWPAANLVFAWRVARRLVAAKPRSVLLVCASLSTAATVALLPELETGEVRVGPTVFGFRLNDLAFS